MDTIKIRNRETQKIYDCFPQCVNLDGKYTLCYNIGIKGYNEWTNICCEYSNEAFNANYEVVKYSFAKRKYIPETEYKFWIDGENAN